MYRNYKKCLYKSGQSSQTIDVEVLKCGFVKVYFKEADNAGYRGMLTSFTSDRVSLMQAELAK